MNTLGIGHIMLKPKMDHAKALMVMGFTSTRSLNPHSSDTKAVLSEALETKGICTGVKLLIG